MNQCYLIKDVMQIIMLLVDDAITYRNLICTCRWMASISRKYVKRRMRELKGFLPPTHLNTYIHPQRVSPNIPEYKNESYGLADIVINEQKISADPIRQHNGGDVKKSGDIINLIFDKDGGTIEFNCDKR